MFLDFMESKGHLAMKSFSLVPQGRQEPPADQRRYGSTESHISQVQRNPAENKSHHMSEMYPYR